MPRTRAWDSAKNAVPYPSTTSRDGTSRVNPSVKRSVIVANTSATTAPTSQNHTSHLHL